MTRRAQNARNQWLRQALRQAGRTQREVATLWGITPAALNRWIMNGATLPVERAVILCHILGWNLSDIIRKMDVKIPVGLSNQESPRFSEDGHVLELRHGSDGTIRLIADVPVSARQAAPLLEIIRAAVP